MAQVDDELAIRRVLAEMTADQPPAPAARYPAVRRLVAVRRRRQLAGGAAAVAVLAAAAIAIPLGLRHFGPPAPIAPSRHYHVSERPPGPGGPHGTVASGVVNHLHWKLAMYQGNGKTLLCWSTGLHVGSGLSSSCDGGDLTPASNHGEPASVFAGGWGDVQVDIGTVRSDVAYLKIAYNNGQVLTAYPVAVLASRYARFFALPAPYAAAVTEMVAYSRRGEIGYAIPFTGDGMIGPGRWLRPGQPALPKPVTALIGSGTANGTRWHQYVSVGPWGTCFTTSAAGDYCSEQMGWMPSTTGIVGQLAFSGVDNPIAIRYERGEARSSVHYLILTTSHGRSARVAVVTAGSRRFFGYASVSRDPVVRWAAYDASGRELGSGRFQY